MEQPNLEQVAKQAPILDIHIIWSPTTGQVQIKWPQVDDIVKLGMLEFAKLTLIEARAKAIAGDGSRITIPNVRLQ